MHVNFTSANKIGTKSKPKKSILLSTKFLDQTLTPPPQKNSLLILNNQNALNGHTATKKVWLYLIRYNYALGILKLYHTNLQIELNTTQKFLLQSRHPSKYLSNSLIQQNPGIEVSNTPKSLTIPPPPPLPGQLLIGFQRTFILSHFKMWILVQLWMEFSTNELDTGLLLPTLTLKLCAHYLSNLPWNVGVKACDSLWECASLGNPNANWFCINLENSRNGFWSVRINRLNSFIRSNLNIQDLYIQKITLAEWCSRENMTSVASYWLTPIFPAHYRIYLWIFDLISILKESEIKIIILDSPKQLHPCPF